MPIAAPAITGGGRQENPRIRLAETMEEAKQQRESNDLRRLSYE
jgi:hypothetical protein